MNIVVIFTGGTIGSTEEHGSIAPQEGAAGKLLKSVSNIQIEGEWIGILDGKPSRSDLCSEEVSYEVCSPMTILSESSTGVIIRNIKEAVEQVLCRSDVDGVMVTHGTDTLMYTAAALGYLFADSAIPIVIVSSNYVLDKPHANGWDNFRYGVAFLAHLLRQDRKNAKGGNFVKDEFVSKADINIPRGVFVSYRNEDGIPRIHRGCAILPHQPYSDEVNSVLNMEYGHFEKDGDWCRFVEGKGGAEEFSIEDMRSCPKLKPPTTWNAPILQIYPYPGMEYPKIPSYVKAILHHSYHSGTICVNKDSNAEVFFEEAKRKGIPVFLCSAFGVYEESGLCETFEAGGDWRNSARYESTKDFEDLGIITLPAASPVAMYMKLWLLLDSGADVVYWMQRKMPGDVSIRCDCK